MVTLTKTEIIAFLLRSTERVLTAKRTHSAINTPSGSTALWSSYLLVFPSASLTDHNWSRPARRAQTVASFPAPA